jgi:hypothetical protein
MGPTIARAKASTPNSAALGRTLDFARHKAAHERVLQGTAISGGSRYGLGGLRAMRKAGSK